MSECLLLDTDVVLWLDSGAAALGTTMRNLIDKVWREDGTLYVSAVSAFEIAERTSKGEIHLDIAPEKWLARFLNRPGIETAAVTLHTGLVAASLHTAALSQAEALIAATAIELDCRLVTYRQSLIALAKAPEARRQGFNVPA